MPEGLEVLDGGKMDCDAIRDKLKNYETLCPRCLKALTPRHVGTLLKALDSIEALPDHLDKLKLTDFCCEDCF